MSGVLADAVFETLSSLMDDTKAPTTGICIITSPPPSFEISLLVIPVFFGEAVDAERFYQPLISLGPFSTCKNVPYPRINDAGDSFGVKGGFKRFSGAGLEKFRPGTWMEVVARYQELTRKVPDARTSRYAIEWNMRDPPQRVEETAFNHHDVKLSAEFLSWYSDPASHEAVSQAEWEVMALAQQDQKQNEYKRYQNWSRDGPIEHRYRGKARQERLGALKQE